FRNGFGHRRVCPEGWSGRGSLLTLHSRCIRTCCGMPAASRRPMQVASWLRTGELFGQNDNVDCALVEMLKRRTVHLPLSRCPVPTHPSLIAVVRRRLHPKTFPNRRADETIAA